MKGQDDGITLQRGGSSTVMSEGRRSAIVLSLEGEGRPSWTTESVRMIKRG